MSSCISIQKLCQHCMAFILSNAKLSLTMLMTCSMTVISTTTTTAAPVHIECVCNSLNNSGFAVGILTDGVSDTDPA